MVFSTSLKFVKHRNKNEKMSKFARSSFIDTLVGQGVTDNIIRTMSGNAAGSKAFHRYHNTMKNKQQNEAVALLD